MQTLQAFIRDADEMEIWIAEKMQQAVAEGVTHDATNVQAKHQRHEAFQAELVANAERLQGILAAGRKLKEKGKILLDLYCGMRRYLGSANKSFLVGNACKAGSRWFRVFIHSDAKNIRGLPYYQNDKFCTYLTSLKCKVRAFDRS